MHYFQFFQRIRKLRSILDDETTNTTSNDEVNKHNQVQTNDSTTSLPEHDSGLSENELCQPTAEPIPVKLQKFPHPLSLSYDVESGINGDYSPSGKPSPSPFVFQHQPGTDTSDTPSLERISFELNSIALDWRSYHAPLHCTCALPFDSAQRRYNCWRCGENFCIRCIEHGIRLPGLYSNSLAPVCKTCARSIKSSPLFADLLTSTKSKYRNQTELKPSTSVIDQVNQEKKSNN